MRNLRNISYNSWSPPADYEGEPITSSCWDPAKDEILCTFGPSEKDGKLRLLRLAEHVNAAGDPAFNFFEIASWEALSPNPDLPVDKVVSLHHFSDNLTTILVLEGGDIVLVRESDSPQDGVHIEIMGSIDEGITAAKWSPDEELLAIATKARTVVFMSRNFEGITDATMTLDDLKLSKQVSVGWGKKETQFQGKGAKALRDPTIPEKVDEGALSFRDDARTTISWRGDGAYVAVNSIEPDTRRVIRVYSREGVLDSVSEAVDGMEGALSWRPAGNLLASVQRKEGGIDVIFFERNGLRHGEFSLRAPEGRDISGDQVGLEWNSDSTVLAVTLNDRIQLWTTGNYHWYLKQEIMSNKLPTCLTWHPEKSLRLAMAIPSQPSARLLQAEFIFNIARGSLVPPNDHGAVAAIDGQTLKLTPLRTANMPPPMAMYELQLKSSIADVAFSPDNTYLAVLCQDGIDLYKWQVKGQRSLVPSLLSTLPLSDTTPLTDILIPRQVSVCDNGNIQLLLQSKYPERHSVQLDAASNKLLRSDIARAGQVYGFASQSQSLDAQCIAQAASGRVSVVSADHGSTEEQPLRLPVQQPWCVVTGSAQDGTLCIYGLTRNGHLYANGYTGKSRLLVKNCTSFLVTPDHLIFTTTNHLLKFVHLTEIDDLEVPADDPEKDERCRSIERGARLVTAMPTNMSLVLQMPRGNTETIFPRAMVVAGIRQLIEDMNYARAFSYCRTQRVDMNVLYDHRPQQFLDNVTVFLDQLKDVTYIDLFLSSLRDEDVTQTMYVNTKPAKGVMMPVPVEQGAAPETAPIIGKTNTVCDAVLTSLRSRKNIGNDTLQNIITANVCKSPPAFEDGLQVVAKLMQEDEQLAERAVEHICFLADVNTLFDEALGLYNLDLALLVAQQSQRDPREYLPFIQGLHKLPDLRQKFAVDDHLGRYAKALTHLQTLAAHEEAQEYTVKHSLYADALRLYRYDENNLKILTRLYAEYLESKSKNREAGLTYESLHEYALATRCYRAAGVSCWREALFTASVQEPPLAKDTFNDLATSLADALEEAKDYIGAATIYLDHLSSLDTAVQYLCKGYQFADALRLVALHARPELLETTIDTGLADALASSTELLADCKAQLRAQIPRIAELRRRAAEDPLAFYEGEVNINLPDDVSVAASSRVSAGGASLFTRYTGKAGSVGTAGTGVSRATSKNRKREEKKRARGRKGTVYEEEYLVNSVRRLVERVQSTKSEVERLVFGLVRRGMFERARTVEALMGEVLEGCRLGIEEVWGKREDQNKTALDSAGGDDGQAAYAPRGGDAVLAESLEQGWRKQEPPNVSGMEKLSLLGS
ncbi:IKI3 family protein [Apiospora kogelbergensis]|uniref:Elongator complex protein 1 n=1 Tax=Apiospora kogelbergensis TaxID=1337665 RepID=A0AAW0R8M8_9PEZI